MAEVYVKKLGTDKAPIFNAQVLGDDGKTSYRQVQVNNVNYVSPLSQEQIQQYIIDNAATSTSEQLTSGAQIIAQQNFDRERAALATSGTSSSGEIDNYEPSLASQLFDKINPFSSNFLGMDLGPKPPKEMDLKGRSTLGDRSVNKGIVNQESKKVSPYNTDTKVTDRTYREKGIIGGSDMSVFFIMSYPSDDLDNKMLPKDQQLMEHVIIPLDNTLSLSYQTLREVFPVRNMGSINPAYHLKGIRTITGNIAFAIFTDDPLGYLRAQVVEKMDRINKNFKDFGDALARAKKTDPDYDTKLQKWQDYQRYYGAFINQASKVQLLDNLPPFTILVLGTNEYGDTAKLMLREVSIIDENQYQGTQQPHAINKVTFTATDIIPMAQIDNSKTVISSVDSVDTSFINGTLNSRINLSNEVTGTKALSEFSKDYYKSNKVGG